MGIAVNPLRWSSEIELLSVLIRQAAKHAALLYQFTKTNLPRWSDGVIEPVQRLPPDATSLWPTPDFPASLAHSSLTHARSIYKLPEEIVFQLLFFMYPYTPPYLFMKYILYIPAYIYVMFDNCSRYRYIFSTLSTYQHGSSLVPPDGAIPPPPVAVFDSNGTKFGGTFWFTPQIAGRGGLDLSARIPSRIE